jgi:hypothetical protein
MLAQILMSKIARFYARATGNSGSYSDAAVLQRGGARPRRTEGPRADRRRADRRSADRRSAGQARQISLIQGEVVQLDAIGYSEEELIALQIKTHREAIALYEGKATGSDAQLRVFARQILPQLQQHLAMLETLNSEKSHAGR